MSLLTRRSLVKIAGVAPIIVGFFALGFACRSIAAEEFAADKATIEQWFNALSGGQKEAVNPLFISRFADPMYFLTQPITWQPEPAQDDVQTVTVPVGFVTDFASIPRIFWTALKPDGIYAWAAVVHDYMYWTQTTSKEVADKTLLYAMEDFAIPTLTKNAIYQAVHLFGGGSWKENAHLKATGEKRILKRYPPKPTITWDEWRKDSSNFE
jgi:hypothetical protein